MTSASNKEKNIFFRKISAALIVTVVTTIMILSMVLYFNFEKIQLSLMNSFMRDGLSKLTYSVNIMKEMAVTMSLKIYVDPVISKLMYYAADLEDTNDALNQLKNYKTTASFIHSIYIYNSKTDTFYINSPLSTNDVQSSSEFFDKDIINIIKNPSEYVPLTPILRRIPDTRYNRGSVKYTNVYTFIYYGENQPGDKIDSLVVINIDEEWLRKVIDSFNVTADSNTYIIDGNGRMVISSGDNAMLTDVSGVGYIKDILSSDKESSSFIGSEDGVKKVVTYVSYDQFGWKFIQTIPYKNILAKVVDMRDKTIVFTLIFLVGGLLVSILISRRLYQPIDVITKRLKVLQREKQSSLNTLKLEFMRNMLWGGMEYDYKMRRNAFESFDIKLKPDDCIFIVLLKIDNYPDFCNKYNYEDRSLLRNGIIDISLKVFPGRDSVEAIDFGEDHIVFLFNTEDMDMPYEKSGMDKIIRDIQENVKKLLDISLSAVISPAGDSLDEVVQLYARVLNNSNYTLFYNQQCIIYPGEVEKRESKNYSYPAHKEKLLIDALNFGDIEEVKKQYRDIIREVIDYTYDAFSMTILHMAFSIVITKNEIEKNLGIYESNGIMNISLALSKLECIEEVDRLFFGIFDDIITKIEHKRNSRYNDLIDNVMEIINGKYMDQNLSLSYIAEKLNMSTVHLGRVFNKYRLESIPQTINEIRIKKAKELLNTTDKSVTEISQLAGFSVESYFYKVFKKLNGVTPNDYRQIAERH